MSQLTHHIIQWVIFRTNIDSYNESICPIYLFRVIIKGVYCMAPDSTGSIFCYIYISNNVICKLKLGMFQQYQYQ